MCHPGIEMQGSQELHVDSLKSIIDRASTLIRLLASISAMPNTRKNHLVGRVLRLLHVRIVASARVLSLT